MNHHRLSLLLLAGLALAALGLSALLPAQTRPAAPATQPSTPASRLAPGTPLTVTVFCTGDLHEKVGNRLFNAAGDEAPLVMIGAHTHAARLRQTGKTLQVKAGWGGSSKLGRVTIRWDGRKAVAQGQILNVARDWPEDPATRSAVDKYLTPKPQSAPAQKK